MAAIITGVDKGKSNTEIKLPFILDLKVSPDIKHPIDIIEQVPKIKVIIKWKTENTIPIFKKIKKGIAMKISEKSRIITRTITLDKNTKPRSIGAPIQVQ